MTPTINLPRRKIIGLSLITGLLFWLVVIVSGWFFHDWHIVILCQNADEIRATGGFLGSIVWLHSRRQGVEITFHDIYDFDAQIGFFPSAPMPVRRYLSAGLDRLHLQDANWERDFAIAAQQISDLLAQARQPKPDLIISLNSTLIENIIDYFSLLGADFSFADEHQRLITSDNFSTLARLDHQLTATPRQPKTRFLRFFAQQLRQNFNQASLKQKIGLIHLIYESKNQRLWQAYSPHPSVQYLLAKLGTSGQLQTTKNCHQIYFVPSNVGVNKSNHASLQIKPIETQNLAAGHTQQTYRLTIVNSNSAQTPTYDSSNLIFADYQRLLLPLDTRLVNVSSDGQSLAIESRLIHDSRGRVWAEFGFLVIIPPQSQKSIDITLEGWGKCWQINQ